MNKMNGKHFLSFILCVVLIAAMALLTVGCNEQKNGDETTVATEKTFTFVVTDENGVETSFTVTTFQNIVGDALLEEGLIEGEEGPYGLYVKKVNGILADYEQTNTYWAFYVDGKYALSGVDTTQITDGAVYGFKVEK